MKNQKLYISSAVFCAALGISWSLAAQSGAPVPPSNDVRTMHVRENIYMIVGPGGNSTVQIGKQGVLLIDAQTAAVSDKVMAEIAKLNSGRLRYVIDTSSDPNRVGGNENLRNAGTQVFAGPGAGPLGATAAQGAAILAHENVLNRMSAPTGKQSPTPPGAWPTETYPTEDKELWFNGESIRLLYQPAAHTDGDTMVYFRRNDLISTGEIYNTTNYPVVDLARGGSIQGTIEALNKLLDLMIPEHEQEDGTLAIPGRGRISDEADVVEYRDMVTIIRDRVQASIKKGLTLDQVKASKPTRDYDGLFRAAAGQYSPDQFVEAVYRSLSAKK
jgi:glyoxylase-like metal-dependent hydrolase (beta-lactamase superfamily II)